MNSVQYEVELDLENIIDENSGDVVSYMVENYNQEIRDELDTSADFDFDGFCEYIENIGHEEKELVVKKFLKYCKSQLLTELFANV